LTHAELQETIPDYLAGRLADAARHTLEQHMEECDECADLVQSWAPIAPELREHGAVIFQPHPTPARLRALAQGSGAEDDDAVAHVAGCPSCALEVEAWRSPVVRAFGGSVSVRPATSVRSGAWWGIAATLAAASLLLFVWRGTRLASPPPPATEWSGAPRMLVLDGSERGGATHPRLELEAGQPYALLGVQLNLAGLRRRRSERTVLARGSRRAGSVEVELRCGEIRASPGLKAR
jgi:hypothetical protein